jgi:hypothetical protein
MQPLKKAKTAKTAEKANNINKSLHEKRKKIVDDLPKQPNTRTPFQESGEPQDLTDPKTAEMIEIEDDDFDDQSPTPEGLNDKEPVLKKPETAAEELSMIKIHFVIRNTHPVTHRVPFKNLDLTHLYISLPTSMY